MRILFVLLGILSVASAITTSPPKPNTLSEFCTGVSKAGSIVSSAMSIKEKKAIDPVIEQRRLAAINTLLDISVSFIQCVEKGTQFSRTGYIVAKDFIYNTEQYIAGEVHPEDVHEIIKPLTKRVGTLLENGKEMHACFDGVQIRLINLEIQLNDDDAFVAGHIEEVTRKFREANRKRNENLIIGGLLAAAAHFVPAAATAVPAMVQKALDQQAIVQNSKHSHENLRRALGDVQYLSTLVQSAKDATTVQIEYWSQTLDDLATLEMASQEWLEDPAFKWTAKKVLAQWKVVLQKYSECSVLIADAGRYVKARLG